MATGYDYSSVGDMASTNNDWFSQVQSDYDQQEQQQDDSDRKVVDGLSSGSLVIPEEGMQRLANNRNARVQIQLSTGLTPEQKADAIAQSFAADTEIRRAAMPIPPEQRSQSADAAKQKLIQELPPDAQGKPWQFDAKSGTLQLPRGYKDPDSDLGAMGEAGPAGPPAPAGDVAADDDPVLKRYLSPGPHGEYEWAKKNKLLHLYDWDGKTGKFGINKERFAIEQKLRDSEEKAKAPKPIDRATQVTEHERRVEGEHQRDDFVKTYQGIMKTLVEVEKPTVPVPGGGWFGMDTTRPMTPEELQMEAARRATIAMQMGRTGTTPGTAPATASDKVSAAVRAARNGDTAAQAALDKRGIKWQP